MGIFKDNGAQIFELAETFNGLNWEAINANNRELVILELIDGILSLLVGVPELSHPCIKIVILKLIDGILSLLDCIPELPKPCIKVVEGLVGKEGDSGGCN
uniref:Uncharacterized protein n=1 Tax=Oryza nivara TaxID=4536 RepID=A0A0E0J7W3_ORYNI